MVKSFKEMLEEEKKKREQETAKAPSQKPQPTQKKSSGKKGADERNKPQKAPSKPTEDKLQFGSLEITQSQAQNILNWVFSIEENQAEIIHSTRTISFDNVFKETVQLNIDTVDSESKYLLETFKEEKFLFSSPPVLLEFLKIFYNVIDLEIMQNREEIGMLNRNQNLNNAQNTKINDYIVRIRKRQAKGLKFYYIKLNDLKRLPQHGSLTTLNTLLTNGGIPDLRFFDDGQINDLINKGHEYKHPSKYSRYFSAILQISEYILSEINKTPFPEASTTATLKAIKMAIMENLTNPDHPQVSQKKSKKVRTADEDEPEEIEIEGVDMDDLDDLEFQPEEDIDDDY